MCVEDIACNISVVFLRHMYMYAYNGSQTDGLTVRDQNLN